MSLCTCAHRPKCQYHHCGRFADWSFFTPPSPWRRAFPFGRLHFLCSRCRDEYAAGLSKPLKGIDRPEGADEDDWQPSIMEHVRHAAIAITFEERNDSVAAPPANYLDGYWREYEIKRGFTPSQCSMFQNLRLLHRKHAVSRPDQTLTAKI
jgi:hypothetical protein